MKLSAEKSILYDIQDKFSFMAPNYKFAPAYKDKRWDGRIRLLNLTTRCMYVGLYDAVRAFCEESGYEVAFEDQTTSQRSVERQIAPAMVETMLSNIVLPTRYSIRDYQKEAVIDNLTKRRNLVLSATGSGKSLIMYLTLRGLLAAGYRVLVLVPRTDLADQLKSDFVEYAADDSWNVDANVHLIYDGANKNPGKKKVVISTWQSMAKMDTDYLSQYTALICDEVHEYTADCTKSILERCVESEVRIGFTGTLRDSKIHEMVLHGLFDTPTIYSTTSELIQRDELSKLKIKGIVLKYDISLVPKAVGYDEEIDIITTSIERMRFLAKLAMSCEGNTIVMFALIDRHANVFYRFLKERAEKIGKRVYLITGEVDKDRRADAKLEIKENDNCIIVASYGVMSTGVNIPNLTNLIFAHPVKSKTRLLQSIGRILRKSENKTVAKVFDIVDDMTCGKKNRKNNSTLEGFLERYERYIEQQFDVELVEYPLTKSRLL